MFLVELCLPDFMFLCLCISKLCHFRGLLEDLRSLDAYILSSEASL